MAVVHESVRGPGEAVPAWLSENDYFKMGAAVAVGELYSAGDLGDRAQSRDRVRRFLASFGIRSMDDLAALGMCGPYVRDFDGLLP